MILLPCLVTRSGNHGSSGQVRLSLVSMMRLILNIFRQYAGSEAWLERDLAAQAGTWQQLAILKRRALEEREMPATPEGLTRSERLLWYRQNQPEIELDK